MTDLYCHAEAARFPREEFNQQQWGKHKPYSIHITSDPPHIRATGEDLIVGTVPGLATLAMALYNALGDTALRQTDLAKLLAVLGADFPDLLGSEVAELEESAETLQRLTETVREALSADARD